jgi:hypothetical protein
MQAPKFIRSLQNIETTEGANIHLECYLQPIGDASMRVEWFVNGKPVTDKKRFHTFHDFDFLVLDVLGALAEDSGVYMAQATNRLGNASTSCTVKIKPQDCKS